MKLISKNLLLLKIISVAILFCGCTNAIATKGQEPSASMHIQQSMGGSSSAAAATVGAGIATVAVGAASIATGIQAGERAIHQAREEALRKYTPPPSSGLSEQQRIEWIQREKQRVEEEHRRRIDSYLTQLQSSPGSASHADEVCGLQQQADKNLQDLLKHIDKMSRPAVHAAVKSSSRKVGTTQVKARSFQDRDFVQHILNADSPEKVVAGLDTLMSQKGSVEEKQQIQSVLSRHLDDNGLIKDWANNSQVARGARLLNAPATKAGSVVRAHLNRALFAHHKALGRNDTDAVHRADRAMQLFLDADHALAQAVDFSLDQRKSQYSLELGKRFLNTGIRLVEFLNGSSNIARYSRLNISPILAQEFHLETLRGDNFEGAELIWAAKKIEDSGLLQSILDDDIKRFHFGVAFHQAKLNAQQQDTGSFLNSISRIHLLLDYCKGTLRGLEQFAADAYEGFSSLLLHPIHSVHALADSIVHWEQTFSVISLRLSQLAESYPNLSLEEKGALHSRVAAEVLTTFLPIGAVKNIATSARVATAIERTVIEAAYFTQLRRASGTVYDFIKPTQLCYPGTSIPKSFEVTIGSNRIWVHPNATKHFAEQLHSEHLLNTFTSETFSGSLHGQLQLTDFYENLRQIPQSLFEHHGKIQIENWEFALSKNNTDQLVVLLHARKTR